MQLENLMNRYFDGVRVGYEVTAPARAALAERARKKKRAKFTLRLVSSFACVLVLVVAVMAASGIFGGIRKSPSDEGSPSAVYTSADVTGKYMNYSQLYEINSSVFKDFEFFEYSHSATATYTAYYDNETDALMYVQIDAKVINDYGTEDLTIFIEFSKESTYDGFQKYYELENKQTVGGQEILYDTQYLDAEWVSAAYAHKYTYKYFFDVTSPDKNSLEKYISFLF